MRLFGVKLLTRVLGTWLNRRSIEDQPDYGGTCKLGSVPKVPFGIEGKEFLLTVGVQSVMNIFTASGFSVQFCVCTL